MSKIITPIPFSRVPKLEFPELVNDFVAIVGKYDPAALHIDGMYNLLLEAQPQVSSLEVIYKKHPESEVVNALRIKRRDLLQAILAQAKSLSKANVASQAADLVLVLPFVEKYFGNIVSENSKTTTERIKQMSLVLESDSLLKAAITRVGLELYLNELKNLQQELEQSISKRRAAVAALPRSKTREVKTDLGVALSDVVEAIELAIKEFPALDYMPMVNEINKLFNEYLSDIKARATRSKNGAVSPDTAVGTTTTAA